MTTLTLDDLVLPAARKRPPEETVVLRYRPRALGQPLLVSVYDKRDGALVLTDTIQGVGEWLDIMGYRWVAASNGVWTKRPETGPGDNVVALHAVRRRNGTAGAA